MSNEGRRLSSASISSMSPALQSMKLQDYSAQTISSKLEEGDAEIVHHHKQGKSLPPVDVVITHDNTVDGTNHFVPQSVTMNVSSNQSNTISSSNVSHPTMPNYPVKLVNDHQHYPTQSSTIPRSGPIMNRYHQDSQDLDFDNTSVSSTDHHNNSFCNITTIEMIPTLPVIDPTTLSSSGGSSICSSSRYLSNVLPSCSCYCTVPNVTSHTDVLKCINEFLRVQSIPNTLKYNPTTQSVAFHCERISALASVGGPTLVFIISVWYEQSMSSTSTMKNVIVDVQRRRGCPLDLQCIRRSLFRTVLDMKTNNGTGSYHNNEGSTSNTTNSPSLTKAYIPLGKRQGMIPLELCRSIWERYVGKSNKNLNDDGSTTTTTNCHSDMSDTNSTGGHHVLKMSEESNDVVSDAMKEDIASLSYFQEMLSNTNSEDNHRMGLECLCQQTDATISDVRKSKMIVSAIVFGTPGMDVPTMNDDDDDHVSVIIESLRNSLLRFLSIQQHENYDPLTMNMASPSSPSYNKHVRCGTGCNIKNLHALALKVMYNAVKVYVPSSDMIATNKLHEIVIRDDDTTKLLSFDRDPFWLQVVQVCRTNITNFSDASPCVTTLSIAVIYVLIKSSTIESKQCIYNLLLPNVLNHDRDDTTSHNNNDTIQSSSLYLDLVKANTWGKNHHSMLEYASNTLMNLLIQLWKDM